MEVFYKKVSLLESIINSILWREPEKVVKFFNPREIRYSSVVTFKGCGEEVEGREFKLVEAHEYTRTLNDKDHVSVDYILCSKPLGGEHLTVRLRVTPNENPTPEDPYPDTMTLLFEEDEQSYSSGLQDTIKEAEEERLWTVTLNGVEDGLKEGETQEFNYTRVHGVYHPLEATVHVIKDKNQNDQIEFNEVEKVKKHTWDYERTIELHGQRTQELFIIEQNIRNHYVWMYRGEVINPSCVDVL